MIVGMRIDFGVALLVCQTSAKSEDIVVII